MSQKPNNLPKLVCEVRFALIYML